MRAFAVGGEDGARRAVAEQRGRDNIAFGNVVLAESQGAELNRQEQDFAAGFGVRDLGGARQAR